MEFLLIIFVLVALSTFLTFTGVIKLLIARCVFEAAVFFKGAATLYVIATMGMGALAWTYGGLYWVHLVSCVAACFLLHRVSVAYLVRNGFTDEVITEIKRAQPDPRSIKQKGKTKKTLSSNLSDDPNNPLSMSDFYSDRDYVRGSPHHGSAFDENF